MTFENKIMNRFDTWYALAPEEPFMITQKNIDAFIDAAEPSFSDSIVDFGCGTARHLIRLEELGFSHLYGVDISSEAISKAKKKIGNGKNISLFHQSFIDFSKSYKNFFNHVVSFDYTITLYSPDTILKYLSSINKIISPEGYFFAEIWNPSSVRDDKKMDRSFECPIGSTLFSYKSVYEPDTSNIVIENSFHKKSGDVIQLEQQIQYVYSIPDIELLCKKTGFSLVTSFGEKDSIGIYILLKKE